MNERKRFNIRDLARDLLVVSQSGRAINFSDRDYVKRQVAMAFIVAEEFYDHADMANRPPRLPEESDDA